MTTWAWLALDSDEQQIETGHLIESDAGARGYFAVLIRHDDRIATVRYFDTANTAWDGGAWVPREIKGVVR